VAAFLRDGDRMLLCHRSVTRRWYPDVWDLPGGHVEDGESPSAALVRELREELGITITEPSGSPMQEIHTNSADMQIWLIDGWTGTPINAAPEEHDTIAWFHASHLVDLHLAHDGYLPTFTRLLAARRD
jgi:8-oxo-dGTP diphosphatase